MQLPNAWNTASGKGIRIAIFADGIDSNNPDLSGNSTGALNRSKVEVLGRPRPANPSLEVNSKGTFMALLAAGKSNNFGGLGMAPDADIVDVKIAEQANLDNPLSSTQAQAMVDAINQFGNSGGQIIVLPFNRLFRDSFQTRADFLMVNNALINFHDNHNGLVFMPSGDNRTRDNGQAAYNHIIVVSGFNRTLNLEQSNTGPAIKISGNQIGPQWNAQGAVFGLSATKYAAAEAAGVAALIWSFNKRLSNTEVERILISTASNNASPNLNYGSGFPNATAALSITPAPVPNYQPYRAAKQRYDIEFPPLMQRVPIYTFGH